MRIAYELREGYQKDKNAQYDLIEAMNFKEVSDLNQKIKNMDIKTDEDLLLHNKLEEAVKSLDEKNLNAMSTAHQIIEKYTDYSNY